MAKAQPCRRPDLASRPRKYLFMIHLSSFKRFSAFGWMYVQIG
jgi:hypothetical protein